MTQADYNRQMDQLLADQYRYKGIVDSAQSNMDYYQSMIDDLKAGGGTGLTPKQREEDIRMYQKEYDKEKKERDKYQTRLTKTEDKIEKLKTQNSDLDKAYITEDDTSTDTVSGGTSTDSVQAETTPKKTTDSSSAETSNQSDSSNSSTDPTINMTDKEKQQNAKMAQMYPERTVDGVYYADDAALARAQKAYDERIAKEAQQADAQAIAKAQKLAEAMKTINETLYGTDNAEVITQLQGSVGGAELSSILGNAVNVRARQHLLDFTKFKEDFKAANSGKPPHNRDPFPVDQKIEEFETHQPRVKVHDIITHNNGKAAAIMGIMQFDATEKRLVKILHQT